MYKLCTCTYSGIEITQQAAFSFTLSHDRRARRVAGWLAGGCWWRRLATSWRRNRQEAGAALQPQPTLCWPLRIASS
eukprot:COSAG01_NODE_16_length_40091_cov_15.728646_30_plen_77_part_00